MLVAVAILFKSKLLPFDYVVLYLHYWQKEPIWVLEHFIEL